MNRTLRGDGPGSWEVEGSAGRAAIAPEEVDRASRTYWEAEADAYQAEHGAFLAAALAIRRAHSSGVPRG